MSNIKWPNISVVINTLNRADSLAKTLDSLRWQRYPGKFEIIVVNGPSCDDTVSVLAKWRDRIHVGTCDEANLSISRNIGILMSQGDIVAFIDDDAIPEPEWLTQLAVEYHDPQVGAVGGLVYDHTGYDFQYQYCLANRLGDDDHTPIGPTPEYCFPWSYQIPHLLGCNSSFRRDALVAIGGFDEEFEYYLDETDVCLRINDLGLLIRQSQSSFVHHRYAPSNIRNTNHVAVNFYPIVKNKTYFMIKHSRGYHKIEDILLRMHQVITAHREYLLSCIAQGLVDDNVYAKFEKDLEPAIEIGLSRGFKGANKSSIFADGNFSHLNIKFFPFTTCVPENYKTVILVSQDYPPNHGGGIGTYTKDLAEELARLGHCVHVITKSLDINRVDFENGVWMHRMLLRSIPKSREALERSIPDEIWNWSATALDEAKRISSHRIVDLVEAPIWDCEGVAFMLSMQWPLVTSLQTTLHFWLETHPEHRANQEWMTKFGLPMLALEKEVMSSSSAIRSISKAIAKEIQQAYNISLDLCPIEYIPVGITESSVQGIPVADPEILRVLFVGRLESRKGIDILLETIPIVLCQCPNVVFRIVGASTQSMNNELNYTDAFKAKYCTMDWFSRIIFEGRLEQSVLEEAYSTCDIFVAPSRFESFGIIYLEAMRAAKPVIGCLTGGIPEIVEDRVNGLVVEPGQVELLSEAIIYLINNPEQRHAMGKAGKEIFRDKFTSTKMAKASILLYDLASSKFANTLS